uniref:Kelch-like protein 20 n=1 Tax=Phallusia mammillata TaxID=59560 RepID=A0A6F9DFB0_9ASCI|nr:kelch-like protein 20 [Phallusia mammillata]
MKEKKQSICHVDHIDDDTLALVLDFIYTQKIWVNQDILDDLLAVTDYFCMEAFSDEIENCCVGLISDDNCVEMWTTGKKFQKQTLIQHAKEKICAHVFFLINSNQFCNIDLHDMKDFSKLIKEKVSDDQLMKCALLWIRHDMEKRMDKFEMFYDMIEPKSLSQSTWVLLVNMKNLVSQNFAAAKAVIPYMRQFVPNAQTELALDTMYVMCQSGDVYSCDMSALKPKAFDNNSIFVPKWVKIKTADYNISKRSLPLIYGFEKLYAIDYEKAWSLRDANWQDEVRLTTKYSKGAVAFVGDTLYVASGTFNCKLESYKKDFSGQRTTQHSSMKYDRSCFALVPYDGYLFAIGCERNTKPTSKNKRRQILGLSVLPSAPAPIEVYTIKSNTWETLTLSGPDILNVKMYLVHQNRAYIVYGDDTIQVATFDLARRQWVTGMNAETGILERCASLTLGFPDFGSCTMGPPLPANTFGSAASFGSGPFGR